MAMSGDAILARGLVKRYGTFEAVRGITFQVPRGQVVALLGPNGAGKTSTMRMLVGLTPMTDGSLTILERRMPDEARAIKMRMGVVAQENHLDSDMTVRDNVAVHARFYGLRGHDLDQRVQKRLEDVRLWDKRDTRATELSGGMKRRLMIARALVNDPQLLILDEPTTGLDPQSRALLWEQIRALRRNGTSILLSTHYMDEAEKLADHVLIMHDGIIIAEGTPRALIATHAGHDVLELDLAPSNDAQVRQLLPDATTERHGDELRVFASDAEHALETLQTAQVELHAHRVRRATLEDVFLRLTGRALRD